MREKVRGCEREIILHGLPCVMYRGLSSGTGRRTGSGDICPFAELRFIEKSSLCFAFVGEGDAEAESSSCFAVDLINPPGVSGWRRDIRT